MQLGEQPAPSDEMPIWAGSTGLVNDVLGGTFWALA
jgi:hypothetical protein